MDLFANVAADYLKQLTDLMESSREVLIQAQRDLDRCRTNAQVQQEAVGTYRLRDIMATCANIHHEVNQLVSLLWDAGRMVPGTVAPPGRRPDGGGDGPGDDGTNGSPVPAGPPGGGPMDGFDGEDLPCDADGPLHPAVPELGPVPVGCGHEDDDGEDDDEDDDEDVLSEADDPPVILPLRRL